MTPELVLEEEFATPEMSVAIDALAEPAAVIHSKKDATLCFVCMQWSCDGVQCHRDDVCPPEEL